MIANCLVVAVIEKTKNPKNKLYYTFKKDGKLFDRFHVLWKDVDEREFHFTRDMGVDVKCGWLFRGHIEELHMGTINKLRGTRLFG